MRTKTFALALLLALFMSVKANADTSGTCGNDLRWTLDDAGNLEITGTGKMYDFYPYGAPWGSEIKTVKLSNGITSIGVVAFYGCTDLTSVEIPNSVTSIDRGAFYGCTGLTSVEIPNSVMSIGDSAFYDCTGLTSVVIGNSVESIGNYAFSDCSGLTKIVLYATEPPTCGGKVFDGVDKSRCKLIVPDGCLDRYRSAEVWKEFLNMSGVYGVAVDDGAEKVTAAGGVITVSGAAADALVDVYSLDGSLVYSGRERSVEVPRVGVYVVRVAGKSQKVFVS